MENDALKPEPTDKSVNCTICYYNCIVGQTYIDSVPVQFYPLCCVADADGYHHVSCRHYLMLMSGELPSSE